MTLTVPAGCSSSPPSPQAAQGPEASRAGAGQEGEEEEAGSQREG